MNSSHPLGLHPVLPSSRKLVKAFEDEINELAYVGTQNRPESIKPAAQRIAGTLFADGVVSEDELELLNRIKGQLNPNPRGDAEAVAKMQAANNLYNALEVDPANHTVHIEQPTFGDLDLPDHAFLPSSRRLLTGMKEAAANLMPSAWDPAKYQAALTDAAKKLVGDGLSGHQKGLVEAMGTAAKNILSHMTYSRGDYPSSLCKGLVELAAAMGAPAK